MKRLVIDRQAIRLNLQTIKERAGASSIYANLSGNAQGMGLLEIATLLRNEGIRTFIVSDVSAASLLRKKGFIEENIMMLRPSVDKNELEAMIDLNVICTVSSLDTAVILSGISSERLDTYTMVGRGGDGALTLRRADGRLFGAVAPAGPLAGAAPGSLVAAQLVTVRGTTYVSGPARLLSGGDAARWHGPALWAAIEQAERAHAMRTTITTPYGKPLSLFDDLYGDHYALPAGPAEASLACLGLHPGEPTMLDFLNLVKPAG